MCRTFRNAPNMLAAQKFGFFLDLGWFLCKLVLKFLISISDICEVDFVFKPCHLLDRSLDHHAVWEQVGANPRLTGRGCPTKSGEREKLTEPLQLNYSPGKSFRRTRELGEVIFPCGPVSWSCSSCQSLYFFDIIQFFNNKVNLLLKWIASFDLWLILGSSFKLHFVKHKVHTQF